MKLVYVAGPFRDKYTGANGNYSQWHQEQNIRRAEEIALQLWRKGFSVICPHLNTRFFQGSLPDETWLNGDLEMIKRCDFVVLVSSWRGSSGSVFEVQFARDHGIRVFEWDNTLRDAREILDTGCNIDVYGNTFISDLPRVDLPR